MVLKTTKETSRGRDRVRGRVRGRGDGSGDDSGDGDDGSGRYHVIFGNGRLIIYFCFVAMVFSNVSTIFTDNNVGSIGNLVNINEYEYLLRPAIEWTTTPYGCNSSSSTPTTTVPSSESIMNTATSNITQQPTSPPTIFYCIQSPGNGMNEFKSVMTAVLPDYGIQNLGGKLKRPDIDDRPSSEHDIFLAISDVGTGCGGLVNDWLLTKYNGHIVYYSAESSHHHIDKSQRHRGIHYFGPVIAPRHNLDIQLTYLQTTWWTYFQNSLPPNAMIDPTLRPKLNKTKKVAPSKGFGDIDFVVYAHGNCVQFRDIAAWEFSKHGIVTCSGRCCGHALDGDRTNLISKRVGGLSSWFDNVELFSNFKFCLVLEHEYDHPAYITEKILMAFIAGCIPIYHGPTEMIFDMFNPKSFVFYNVSNPEPSLDLVRKLSMDEALYDAMQQEPIAAHGYETIQQYFSFSDSVGDGVLKSRIRNILGISSTTLSQSRN